MSKLICMKRAHSLRESAEHSPIRTTRTVVVGYIAAHQQRWRRRPPLVNAIKIDFYGKEKEMHSCVWFAYVAVRATRSRNVKKEKHVVHPSMPLEYSLRSAV